MEAQITIKLTPSEFDDIRKAVTFTLEDAAEWARDSSIEAKQRAEFRVQTLRLQDILAKLR